MSLFLRCDQTPQWPLLKAHFSAQGARLDLRHAFAEDTGRFEYFSQVAPHLFADLFQEPLGPDHRGTAARHGALVRAGAAPRRHAARRAHQHHRGPRGFAHPAAASARAGAPGDLPGVAESLVEVHSTLNAMLAFADRVRADEGITGRGEHRHRWLGPGAAHGRAGAGCLPRAGQAVSLRFNADGHELAGVLRLLRPQSTLFLVASKTFTTAETMTNARSCLARFAQQGGTDVARHFVALTTQVDAAKALGITTTFGFWEWVGGRYSLWSSIGLPLAISIGAAGFRGLLADVGMPWTSTFARRRWR